MTARLAAVLLAIVAGIAGAFDATGSDATAADATAADARIELMLDRPGRPVPHLLFGSNLQWENNGDDALLAGSDDTFGWRPGLLDRLRESGLSFLRFPGGSLANTYDWAAGIGPGRDRPPGLSYAGTPTPSTFGTDELLRLVQPLGWTAMLTVNLDAGEAAASDWVDYVNGGPDTLGGRRRAANGLTAPLGVRYWEVGNELFNARERGHLRADAYGRRAAAFARAMRARDPSISVGAMLEGSFQLAPWVARVLPELPGWNEAVLRAAGPDIGFVAIHFGAPYDTLWRDANLHELVWSAPLVLEATLARVEALLGQYAAPGTGIAITEYTTFFGGDDTPAPRVSGTENALFDALVLFVAMRDPAVFAAANWSLLNNANFGLLQTGSGGAFEPRPNFLVIRTLAGFADHPLVPLRMAGPTYAVDAKGNVPALHAVPMLDGVAVLDGASVRVALVNRSARRTVTALVTAGRPLGAGEGATYVPADAEGTRWAAPVEAAPTVTPEGLVYSLPAASFTILRLSVR